MRVDLLAIYQPFNQIFYFINMKKYKITQKQLQNLIDNFGITKTSKKLKIGYLKIKQMCDDLNIEIKLKKAGRKKII